MMIKIPKIKVLLLHVFSVCLFIFLEIGMVFILGTKAPLIDFVIYYIVEITFFYLNAYWLLPLLSQKKFKIAATITLLLIWIFFICTASNLIKFAMLRYYGQIIPISKIWSNWYLAFWRYLFLFTLSSSFWYARHSIQSLRRAKDQELEILRTRERQANLEIALLRSQLNPHLMYNALSGIHTYLYLKSPEASEIIIKLNKVMEASLRGSNPEIKATLGDEISLLQDLIDLHRSMQLCHLTDKIEVPSNILDIEFPPNLFVGILENVFKHGILTDQDEPAEFSIRYYNGQLRVSSKNLVALSQANTSYGIGLNNLKQRLEKHYPGQYELSAQVIDHNYYLVDLTITL